MEFRDDHLHIFLFYYSLNGKLSADIHLIRVRRKIIYHV